MEDNVEMETKEVTQIPWSESVWFFDIDDTLIDTAGTTIEASEGIREVFEAKFSKEQAVSVQNNFNRIFQLMLAGLRNKTVENWAKTSGGEAAYKEVFEKVENCQQEIKSKYGSVKKFSREVFIKIAAEQANLEVSPEVISEAADAYWVTLTEKTKIFPGVLELIKEIKNHGRPIYLVTSSDARLRLKEDGQFEYVPQVSEAFKRERVQLLRNKGIDFNLVSIGDPEDKPHMDFFQKALKLAEEDLGKPVDLRYAIFLGDSFAADLVTPKEMGFGLVVLFQDDRAGKTVEGERQITTGNLSEVANYLSD